MPSCIIAIRTVPLVRLSKPAYTRSFSFIHPRLLQHSPQNMQSQWTPNRYPPARRSDHVDVYKSEKHGEVRVADPYQWLEHSSEETEGFVNAQVALTREFLDSNPDRQKLEDEIRNNSDYAKVSLGIRASTCLWCP